MKLTTKLAISLLGIYAIAMAQTNLKQAMSSAQQTNPVLQQARSLTPVGTSSHNDYNNTKSQSNHLMLSTSNGSITGSSKIYGGVENNQIGANSSTGVTSSVSTVIIAKIGVPYQLKKWYVPYKCKTEGFDDAVFRKFASVSMSTTYVDIDGHNCKLGSMTKYCYVGKKPYKVSYGNTYYIGTNLSINRRVSTLPSGLYKIHDNCCQVKLSIASYIGWYNSKKDVAYQAIIKGSNGKCGGWGYNPECVWYRDFDIYKPSCSSSGSTTWYK